jgi:hypothetical protein
LDGVLELYANFVALDPNDTAVPDYSIRFGHQLKPDWNAECVRDLYRRPFGGDIRDDAARTGPHMRNVSRLLDGRSVRFSSFLKH